jgi:hypothetical protein
MDLSSQVPAWNNHDSIMLMTRNTQTMILWEAQKPRAQ